MASEWLIWQLVDSAFPSGGFTHSGGLEAAWQHKVVTDGESLLAFLRANLVQLNRGLVKFVDAAWQEPQCLDRLDEECDLFLNNHVTNRASRMQGRAFVSSASKIFMISAIVDLAGDIRERQLPGHFAPVFGAVTRSLEIDRPTASSLYAFNSLRSCISAAVRMGIVGPIEGQQIQAQLAAGLGQPDESEPVQTSPMLDLLQATHDRLYSRLFQT